MAKQEKTLRFTFENPNDSRAFARELSRILIEKLAQNRQNQ